jgi:hypothetical protein
MHLSSKRRRLSRIVLTMVLAGGVCSPAINAQTPASVEIVNYAQRGAPPSGPFPVVIEHDSTLITHTIYRPAALGRSKHGVLVWGEGACVKNGLTFPEFLSEIASYGFVVVADGPPVMPAANAARGGAPGGAPAVNGAPRGQGAAAPPGPARGGAPLTINADGTPLTAAIDWLAREASDRTSRFYQKVDTSRVAAMGMSCGGLMAYNVSADPRVATVGIWNSGCCSPMRKSSLVFTPPSSSSPAVKRISPMPTVSVTSTRCLPASRRSTASMRPSVMAGRTTKTTAARSVRRRSRG